MCEGRLLSSANRTSVISLHVVQRPKTTSVKHAERGPSSSLGIRSVDAQRHKVSSTTASNRQGLCINQVQCDSSNPRPACWPQKSL